MILSILIFIIYLSILYYHGVLVHILESRLWEPSDEQEEGNSANLNNYIIISDRLLYSPAMGVHRIHFRGGQNKKILKCKIIIILW